MGPDRHHYVQNKPRAPTAKQSRKIPTLPLQRPTRHGHAAPHPRIPGRTSPPARPPAPPPGGAHLGAPSRAALAYPSASTPTGFCSETAGGRASSERGSSQVATRRAHGPGARAAERPAARPEQPSPGGVPASALRSLPSGVREPRWRPHEATPRLRPQPARRRLAPLSPPPPPPPPLPGGTAPRRPPGTNASRTFHAHCASRSEGSGRSFFCLRATENWRSRAPRSWSLSAPSC